MTLKPLPVLAALALVGSSSAALAQSAAPLSLANSPAVERAGASLGEPNDLHGPTLWIAGIVALGLIVWGITALLDDEEAFPNSP